MNYLQMLLLFLRPNIGPGDEEGAEGTEGEGAEGAEGEGSEPDPDADLGEGEGAEGKEGEEGKESEGGEPEKKARPKASEVIREQKRLRQEAIARAERAEREADELRRNQQQRQSPSEAQKRFEEEERKLADPATDEQTKYWIRANRTILESKQDAQAARFEAADTRDRTAFAALALTEGKNYTKYAPLVEKELERLRREGQNPPREAIYTFLLGKDTREALKRRDASPPKKKEAERGKLPGARSDVGNRGNGATEHQKRYERLKDMNI